MESQPNQLKRAHSLKQIPETQKKPGSSAQIWAHLASGKNRNTVAKSKTRRTSRPSSAVWAELSSTKGMHESSRIKVEEKRKMVERQPSSDISHIKQLKSLNEVLNKQKNAENKAKKRLEHIYGPDHEENKKYNQEEFERRKREQRKKELKALLAKYVATDSHNEFVALNLQEA